MGHLDTVRALVHAVCERERERASEPWCMRDALFCPRACGMLSFSSAPRCPARGACEAALAVSALTGGC